MVEYFDLKLHTFLDLVQADVMLAQESISQQLNICNPKQIAALANMNF